MDVLLERMATLDKALADRKAASENLLVFTSPGRRWNVFGEGAEDDTRGRVCSLDAIQGVSPKRGLIPFSVGLNRPSVPSHPGFAWFAYFAVLSICYFRALPVTYLVNTVAGRRADQRLFRLPL